MIGRILRKDWTLLWPMVLLVTALQAGLEVAVFHANLANAGAVAGELVRPLTLAWYSGIAALTVAVVQQDAIPGAEQDWLIRPLRRRDLWLAKFLFVLAAVSLPMFILDLAHALRIGFPAGTAAALLGYKEAYVFVFLAVPMFALASATRNMTELMLLGAASMVAYSASSGASAFLLGADRCPTCGTGLMWMEHVVQHVATLVGAIAILVLQYRYRRTALSRILAVLGAGAVVFVQVPWDAAFALQSWGNAPGAADRIVIELGPVRRSAAAAPSPPPAAASARQAARALLRGEVDEAVDTLRRGGPAARPAVLEVAQRVGGIPADALLLVDRLSVSLENGNGVIYRTVVRDEAPDALSPSASDASGAVPLELRVPDRSLALPQMTLHLDYWLTWVQSVAEHRIAALGGELRSPDIGLCRAGRDGDAVALRCRQIGRAPFCIGATLFNPDGSHNPEVTKCAPDYRPYVPAFADILGYVGLDLPVRDRSGLAHYAVDPSMLEHAYLLVRVYGVREHFRRSVSRAIDPG